MKKETKARTVDSLEHAEHGLVVGVVEEPYRGIALILLERHGVGVGDIELAFVVFTKKHTYHTLSRVLRHPVVMVCSIKRKEEETEKFTHVKTSQNAASGTPSLQSFLAHSALFH